MIKRRFTLLLVALLTCSLFVGCNVAGTPDNEEDDGNADSTVDKIDEGAEALAELVAAGDLPVSGIGSSCTTTLTAKENYTLAVIVKNNTNPACTGWMNGVAKACKDMGIECLQITPSVNDSVEEH